MNTKTIHFFTDKLEKHSAYIEPSDKLGFYGKRDFFKSTKDLKKFSITLLWNDDKLENITLTKIKSKTNRDMFTIHDDYIVNNRKLSLLVNIVPQGKRDGKFNYAFTVQVKESPEMLVGIK